MRDRRVKCRTTSYSATSGRAAGSRDARNGRFPFSPASECTFRFFPRRPFQNDRFIKFESWTSTHFPQNSWWSERTFQLPAGASAAGPARPRCRLVRAPAGGLDGRLGGRGGSFGGSGNRGRRRVGPGRIHVAFKLLDFGGRAKRLHKLAPGLEHGLVAQAGGHLFANLVKRPDSLGLLLERLDQVKTERGADRLPGVFARLQGESGLFESRNHLAGLEESKIATLRRRCGVFGNRLCDLAEVFALLQFLQGALDLRLCFLFLFGIILSFSLTRMWAA